MGVSVAVRDNLGRVLAGVLALLVFRSRERLRFTPWLLRGLGVAVDLEFAGLASAVASAVVAFLTMYWISGLVQLLARGSHRFISQNLAGERTRVRL